MASACFAAREATTACLAQGVDATHRAPRSWSGSACALRNRRPASQPIDRDVPTDKNEKKSRHASVGAPCMPARRRHAEQVGTEDTRFGEDVSRTCSTLAAPVVMPPAMWRSRHGLLCRSDGLMLLPPITEQKADPVTSDRKSGGKSADRVPYSYGNLPARLRRFFRFVPYDARPRRGRSTVTSPNGRLRWVMSAASKCRTLWYSQVSTKLPTPVTRHAEAERCQSAACCR